MSPLQANYSAATACSKMMIDMHHATQLIGKNISVTEDEIDCCTQTTCTTTHCTGSIVAAIVSSNSTQTVYLFESVNHLNDKIVNSYFKPSLYRPPKF